MMIALFDKIENEIERLSGERAWNRAYFHALKITPPGLRLK
jgi:hypothetical protein